MRRTSNPALKQSIFAEERAHDPADSMTIQGTINKCFILLGLVLISASWIWQKFLPTTFQLESGQAVSSIGAQAGPYIIGGAILGLIFALVTIFNRPVARFTAPAYALCEGVVLGGISIIYEQMYPGIVMQAVGLTFATMFCMLGIYKSGLIKVDKKFIVGISAATGAICLVYFVNFIMQFFGSGMSFIYSSSPIGIGFSVLVCGIAAFNLIVDFYVIEQGAATGAKKYMEWYGAFGLMVTLIWLYLEILRLLGKMRRR